VPNLAMKMDFNGLRMISQTMAYLGNQPLHVSGAVRFR